MIIRRRYIPEQKNYSFRKFRRRRALKLAKKMKAHLDKSFEYGKEADSIQINDPDLMKKAVELAEKNNHKVYDYNPFSNGESSGSLKTGRGLRSGMYTRLLLKGSDKAKKFLDDGSYINSSGQIFLPKGKGVEELLHEEKHLESKGIWELIANNTSVRGNFEGVPNNKVKNPLISSFIRPIKSKSIMKEESKASTGGLAELEKLGATKEQLELARRKYALALDSYKERAKAYNKEPRKEWWKGKKKRK